MRLLPDVRTLEDRYSFPRDEGAFHPAIREICRRHALPATPAAKYPGGSRMVFSVGTTHVVKLFEPIFAEAAETEEAALRHVNGKLGVPTPRVLASGELEGWR